MRQYVGMSVLRDFAKIVRVTARGTRVVARGVQTTATGTTRASRWVSRNVGSARQRGGVGNVGLMRLLDLHAVSCAGDTLITIGLAGTIFFSVPAGEARGRVALYLLITMVPFALLAPVVGPVLDRFRHGRRLALAATMLGRALLTWVIADNLFGFGLYPAAFGVLALSRAYGVARSAAVPRLLPPGLGLSQAGARASVYGTVAGAIVAPIGAAAFAFGPQWPLRVASLIFLAGMVVALNLPPKADSDPPEVAPKVFQVPWRHRREGGGKVLSGRLVLSALAGSAGMRTLYGFLLLFLAFAIREHELSPVIFGITLNDPVALAVVGGALGLGTFLSTAIGTRLRIRRPVRLQAFGFGATGLAGAWAAVHFTLTAVALFCLVAAIASGLAKLAVDASIQERIPDTVRASAFAHAETLLMLAWVAGGAIGLTPFLDARLGIALAAIAILTAAAQTSRVAWRLRAEVLRGDAARADPAPTSRPYPQPAPRRPAPSAAPAPARIPAPLSSAGAGLPAEPDPDDEAPAGYHLFRPSTPDGAVTDPRTGA
jgi:MFS family permease